MHRTSASTPRKWIVTTAGEGTDTLQGVAAVDGGSSPHHFLLVGGGSQYATIQEAVDAAQAGDTILVAPGTYAEQVVVDPAHGHGANGISIIGIGSVTLDAPASLHSTGNSPTSGRDIDGLFTVNGASNVTIEGISVNGLLEGASVTGANNPTLVGIAYLNASGTVDHVDVTGIREGDASFGDQRGIAIFASNTAPVIGPANSFTVTNSSVEDFQKGGIVVFNATVEISHDTVTGVGATGLNAQNGIQVSGVSGDVSGNTVSEIGYIPAGTTATGILFWNSTNLTIEDNTITGALDSHGNPVSQVGIYGLNSSNVTIDGNTISDVLEGIGAFEDTTNGFAGVFAPTWSVGITNTVTDSTQFALDFEATDPVSLHEATGNFTVTGTTGNDFFMGGAGNDGFTGGGGFDRAGFIETLAPSNFSYSGGKWTVTTAGEGTDTLSGFSVVADGNGSGHRFILVSPDSNYITIQAAVNAAHDGDTILLAPGTYTENVAINGIAVNIEGLGGANGVNGAILKGSITETGALNGNTGHRRPDHRCHRAAERHLADADAERLQDCHDQRRVGQRRQPDRPRSSMAAVYTLTVDTCRTRVFAEQRLSPRRPAAPAGSTYLRVHSAMRRSPNVQVFGQPHRAPRSPTRATTASRSPASTRRRTTSPTRSATSSFDNVSVTGTYAKTLVYIQGYDDATGLTFHGPGADARRRATTQTGWTSMFVDLGPQGGTEAVNTPARRRSRRRPRWRAGASCRAARPLQRSPLAGLDDLIVGTPNTTEITGTPGNDAIVYNQAVGGVEHVDGGAGTDAEIVVGTRGGVDLQHQSDRPDPSRHRDPRQARTRPVPRPRPIPRSPPPTSRRSSSTSAMAAIPSTSAATCTVPGLRRPRSRSTAAPATTRSTSAA